MRPTSGTPPLPSSKASTAYSPRSQPRAPGRHPASRPPPPAARRHTKSMQVPLEGIGHRMDEQLAAAKVAGPTSLGAAAEK